MSPIERSAGGVGGGTQGSEIGYDPITAAVNITALSEATSNTLISCAAHTFDGGLVLLTVYSPQVAFSTQVGDFLVLSLWEGATELGDIATCRSVSTTQQSWPFTAERRFTPTAGSHTYQVKGFVSSTTGTPSFGAGTGGVGQNMPAFARFTKV